MSLCLGRRLVSRGFKVMSAVKGSPSKARLVSSRPVLDTNECKWIGLEKMKYLDPNGNEREWDCAVRKTRNTGNVDGIGIFTILNYKDGRPLEVLLQKQFRPPVEGVCIEVPAGLIDADEGIETAALRELLEETGYIGKIIKQGPIIYNDPGFTNTNMSLLTAEVDMTLDENKNPKTQLEENEFIECFTVPLKELPEEMLKLEKEGYKLDARIQNVAHGIAIARQYNL
ncbi:ADP-ribose diphosphatase KNAG_0B01450 [Huiozyma naganishii CBS 8797]|uniref:Nudix hydrolase domain-containing protein n=1 Tax=Huiozyma naganishii (strain ATCC MYA-139 / BCRC 22969 / CBS 8797 / KCTC 17520 / NBRC 10181 / NCYC 3082 / Yp74L-3) TaxID=1071383 RepID=J7RGC7_HUIN7|nr:hypothetical protein KNAG_0B01450 [Kazachstania naganishii CBS 8797]CCK68593.1 hypothetical protein KNAG_0B01450 [Kazachstania naganishii CBS 8797]